MQISLRLGEHGWSDLDLWIEDKHQVFCITHIFNSPMVEIANALLSLHLGDKEATFDLYEEPGRHIWTMTKVPEEQHLLLVEIRSYEEHYEVARPAFQVTEFRVARDFFIDSFNLEFNKIASQLRHPQFAKNRNSEDFPWDTLGKLRSRKSKRSEQ
jgi:hypothetical protein